MTQGLFEYSFICYTNIRWWHKVQHLGYLSTTKAPGVLKALENLDLGGCKTSCQKEPLAKGGNVFLLVRLLSSGDTPSWKPLAVLA